MERRQWSTWTDVETIRRRARGRRRYNALRRRRAEERRAAMVEALEQMGPAMFLALARGLAPQLASLVGCHRVTAWRDLQRIIGTGPICNLHDTAGNLLATVTRACQGGPIVSVADPDGYEIHGARRRAILRQVPRYPH